MISGVSLTSLMLERMRILSGYGWQLAFQGLKLLIIEDKFIFSSLLSERILWVHFPACLALGQRQETKFQPMDCDLKWYVSLLFLDHKNLQQTLLYALVSSSLGYQLGLRWRPAGVTLPQPGPRMTTWGNFLPPFSRPLAGTVLAVMWVRNKFLLYLSHFNNLSLCGIIISFPWLKHFP